VNNGTQYISNADLIRECSDKPISTNCPTFSGVMVSMVKICSPRAPLPANSDNAEFPQADFAAQVPQALCDWHFTFALPDSYSITTALSVNIINPFSFS